MPAGRRRPRSPTLGAVLAAAALVTSGCGDAPQPDVDANEPASDPPTGLESTAGDTITVVPNYGVTPTAPVVDPVPPDVVADFEADGRVEVIVSLAATADPVEIAATAERVLDDLEESAFDVRIRFENVPAIAGTVTSPSALDVFRTHPDVVAVSLDAGGTGSGGG